MILVCYAQCILDYVKKHPRGVFFWFFVSESPLPLTAASTPCKKNFLSALIQKKNIASLSWLCSFCSLN